MKRPVGLLKGFAIALTLFVVLTWLLSRAFQPGSVQEAVPEAPAEQVEEARTLRDIALVGKPPELVVEVDYSQREQAAYGCKIAALQDGRRP